MKKIKIINTSTGLPVVIESEATTLAQLKNQLASHDQLSNIDWSSISVFQKDSKGKAVIGLDEQAISSDETFNIYLTPAKHKGGLDPLAPSQVKELRTRFLKLCNALLAEYEEDEEYEEPKVILTKEDEEDLEFFRAI